MIIQCDKCATKFRLDDSRITPNGVKVRCTRCQNVFIVTPPPPADEVQLDEIFGVAPQAPAPPPQSHEAQPAAAGAVPEAEPQKPKAKAEEKKKNLAFDFDEKGLDPFAPGNASAPEGQKAPEAAPNDGAGKLSLDNIDFSFSQDRSDEEPAKDDWGLGGDEDERDPFEFNIDEKPATDEKSGPLDFSFGDLLGNEPAAAEQPKEASAPSTPPAGGISAEPRPEAKAPPSAPADSYTRDGRPAAPEPPKAAAPTREEKSPFKDVLSEEITREDLPEFEEGGNYGEEEAEKPRAAARPRSMGLTVALVVIIIGGGLIYFTGVIDRLTSALMPPAVADKTVEIESINGYFAENRNFGRLFVIEARIKNVTDDPQSIKAATGIVYNDKGDKLGSRSVSPGRIVSPDDVRNLSVEELARAFKDPSGGVIPPKGTVPVMVLFTPVPEGTVEYGLDIVR